MPSFSEVMLSGKRSLGWLIEISVILSAANKGAPMAHRVMARVRRGQEVVTNFIPTIIPYGFCSAQVATSLSFRQWRVLKAGIPVYGRSGGWSAIRKIVSG